MRHFPVFLKIEDKRILVSGGGQTAIAKLRLLLKSKAEIVVFSPHPAPQILEWEASGALTLKRRKLLKTDFHNAVLLYAADNEKKADKHNRALGRIAGVPVNIVDNLEASDFITPAIVDRDPVTVAIGTEGTAPVLARRIKSRIEDMLPSQTGTLARIGNAFRSKAINIRNDRQRRNFWTRFFFQSGPSALARGGEEAAGNALEALYHSLSNLDAQPGRVTFVGAGPGDPELLTRKAHRLLHEADIVIHDRLVSSQILELARREAEIIQTGKKGFDLSWKQEDINTMMIEHARKGAHVIRLKSGDPTIFARLDEEMDALDQAGVDFEIIPGITTASAAAAGMNVSLTRRKRNSALRIMTAHDIRGFAEHDWHDLAKNGAVAAVYMGMKQAHFLSGRLLMHGASPDIPVTIMENVSRPDQRIWLSSLATLAKDAAQAGETGPVILMLGLSPRKLPMENLLPDINTPIRNSV